MLKIHEDKLPSTLIAEKTIVKDQPLEKTYLGSPLSLWERTALLVSQPTYWISESIIRARVTPTTPGIWGNCDNESQEKLRRIATIYGNLHFKKLHTFAELYGFGLLSMPCHYTAGLLNYVENSLNPKDYTYIVGNAPECREKISEPKVLTLNACMYWGGQPISQGGVQPARYRIEQFCNKISEVNPDILVCQEISLDPAVKIIENLKENYAHFYTNIGPFPWKMESNLFVASKLPIVSAPQFYPFPNLRRVRAGFFCFETPEFWAITTHLSPVGPEMRREQLAEITKKIDELQNLTDKPCILIGDLNIGRTEKEEGEYVTSGIREMYVDNYEKEKKPFILTPQNATWTGLLDQYSGSADSYSINGERAYWEMDDYALIRKGQEDKFTSFNIELLPTFELDEKDQLINPENALSDHKGLIVTFKIDSKTSSDD